MEIFIGNCNGNVETRNILSMLVDFIIPLVWKPMHLHFAVCWGWKEIAIGNCNGNRGTGNVLSMLMDFIIPFGWKLIPHFAVCCGRNVFYSAGISCTVFAVQCGRKEIVIVDCNENGRVRNVLSMLAEFRMLFGWKLMYHFTVCCGWRKFPLWTATEMVRWGNVLSILAEFKMLLGWWLTHCLFYVSGFYNIAWQDFVYCILLCVVDSGNFHWVAVEADGWLLSGWMLVPEPGAGLVLALIITEAVILFWELCVLCSCWLDFIF